MSDLIDRQQAIDIERNATVDTNPSHFEAHQKFTQFMDDAEVSSFGRWQWSNGFNTALTAVGIDLKKLPSAQPDLDSAYTEGYTAAESKYREMWDEMPKIVYCRECMHREYCFSDVAMTNRSQTSTIYESIEYCSKGERRTDATTI